MGWKTRWTILSSVIRKSICTRVPLVNLNHAFIISCCHLRFKVGLWVIEFCLYTRFFEGLRFMCQLVSTCWLRSRCPAVWNCLFTGSATIQRYQASAKCNRMWKRKRETGKDYRHILFETEICIYIYISARGCLWIMVCSPHTWNIHLYIYIDIPTCRYLCWCWSHLWSHPFADLTQYFWWFDNFISGFSLHQALAIFELFQRICIYTSL